jgi:hypothetical protein
MQFIYDLMGLPIDQAKFLLCEAMSLILGLLFRWFIRPNTQNVFYRHAISIVVGLFMGFYCFNIEYLHICFVAFTSYLILIALPRHYAHL